MIRNFATIAGLAVALAIGIASAPTAAGAQQQAFTIKAPDGGDCRRLGGIWNGSNCRFGALAIQANQVLFISGRASVSVTAQLVNFGTLGVIESGELTVGLKGPGVSGAFINGGSIVITPTPGLASPGISNHAAMQNNGVIFNTRRIFNNFGTIANTREIRNAGFFHNSGPPVQSRKALIASTGNGFFDNNGGTLENRGDIRGRVF
jgi:hypothetical protein